MLRRPAGSSTNEHDQPAGRRSIGEGLGVAAQRIDVRPRDPPVPEDRDAESLRHGRH